MTKLYCVDKASVVSIIKSEPEYPDAEKFIDNVTAELSANLGLSKEHSLLIAETIIECARIAVRQTKSEILKKVEVL